jgi:DNA polymerase I-like protein with 3'-5' exonuclease and polymerase domains
VCRRVLGKEVKSYSDTVSEDSTFLDLPLIEMVNHACQDADFALRLYPALSRGLKERCIARQFRENTMRHLGRLSNLEFHGMAIDVERLRRIKRRISRRAEHLRSSICTTAGRVVDLEAHEDLAAVLRETAQLQGDIGPRRATMSALEQLVPTITEERVPPLFGTVSQKNGFRPLSDVALQRFWVLGRPWTVPSSIAVEW